MHSAMGWAALALVVCLQCYAAASSLHVQPVAAVVQQPRASPEQLQQPSTQDVQLQQRDHSSTGPFNSTATLPGESDPVSDAMIQWLLDNGAEVNVAIRKNVPGVGRGTFAPWDLHKGDVLARIPVEMVYALTEVDDSLVVSASYLVADMAEEDSPWGPYFRALPPPSDVWSTPHVPQAYMPIIQDPTTETAITHMQQNVQELWKEHGAKYVKVLGPTMSSTNITYAMGLLLSRLFRFDGTDIMLPIVDMANHMNGCQHSHLPEPCDPEAGNHQWENSLKPPTLAKTAGNGMYGPKAHSSSSSSNSSDAVEQSGAVSGQCLVWRAEETVKAGEEVCNSYKVLLQDRALLQYGFLQSGKESEELSMIDRAEFVPDVRNAWVDPAGTSAHGPKRFEGTPAQIWAEVDRLKARIEMLKSGDAAVAAIKPDASDPDGRYLATMLEWRRQRKASMAREISRLTKQAVRLEAAQKAWGPAVDVEEGGGGSAAAAESGLVSASRGLTEWLESNGAEVRVELRHLRPETPTPINSTPQQVCTAAPDGSSSASQSCPADDPSASSSIKANAGVFVRQAVKQGDKLAVIPVSLAYPVEPGLGMLDSAVRLMMDLYSLYGANSSSVKSSVHKALLQALPPFGSVRSGYNFPAEYMSVLQNENVEYHLKRLSEAMAKTFDDYRGSIEDIDNSITIAELQHAATLLAAHPLLSAEDRNIWVPLFTHARHNSTCTHDHYLKPCPGTASSNSTDNLCFYWVAGSDLEPGAEVCVSYGYLRADQALIMYGIPVFQATGTADLQEDGSDGSDGSDSSSSDASSSSRSALGGVEGPELWLHGMDTMEAEVNKPFGDISRQPPQHWVPENREEALAECLWLIELHKNWTDPSVRDAVNTLQPAPSDPLGVFLDQLMLWRQHRIAALEWELGRLSDTWNISAKELLAAKGSQQGLAGAVAGDASSVRPDNGLRADFGSNNTDAWQRMLEWMRYNGAIINVNVTDAGPQFGRIVVADTNMSRGDLLAAIPVEVLWNTVTAGGNGTLQLAAANLWAEIESGTSPWKPYLDALPSEDEMLCPLVSLPKEYLHVLQSEHTAFFLAKYQQALEEFWKQYGEDMTAKVPSLTYDKFKYARGLLATRLFGLDIGASMIPLLDLANHAPFCPNMHTEQDCPHNPDRKCVVWLAGGYLPAGAEVCNGYKWMTNDKSMLQYGFLQSGPIKDQLHIMDYPGVDATNVFSQFDRMKYGPPPFNGTESEITAELDRLKSLLADLTAGDAAAAATTPAPSDKGGRLLSLMLSWREERKAALQREVARLEGVLEGMKGGSGSQQQQQAAEEKLVEWINANGGQIKGVRIASQTDKAPSTGRGVFATEHIQPGSLMAVVPLDLSLAVHTDNLLMDGPLLWSEISHTLSPNTPYYNILPQPSEVFSFYELPIEYAPVIQHQATEEFILASVNALAQFKEHEPAQYSSRNMTDADLVHVFSLIATRLIHFPQGGYMVPFIDMANHINGCPHTVGTGSCDTLLGKDSSSSSSSRPGSLNTTRTCVYWKARAAVQPGEEVCLKYGYLLPDRAMLQYGYLPEDLTAAAAGGEVSPEVAVPLFGIDRHDFDSLAQQRLPWRFWLDEQDAPPAFTGDAKQTKYEILRLELLADELAAGEAAAAAVEPVSSVDPDGHILQQLRVWRQLRKAAIAQEIKRLQQAKQQL